MRLTEISLLLTVYINMATGQAYPPIPNVRYGSDPQQILDIYLQSPNVEDVSKVIVLIHGGAWGGGDRDEMLRFIPFLQADFPTHVITNINYRLGTDESPGFPKQLEDIELALSFLRTAFPSRVTFALLGMSAGAHLSMLYAYSLDSRLDDPQVSVVVNLVGPTDITHPSYSQNPLYTALFFALVGGCTYAECPDLYNVTSPVTYAVDVGTTKTIGFYGDADILIPNSQMPIIKERLEALGVPSSFTMYPGGHGDWAAIYQLDMMARIKAFFNAHW